MLKESEWGVVPHPVKVERLERLQTLQKRISTEVTLAQVGETMLVLVEGRSKTDAARRYGRNPQNRAVNFEGDAPIGAIVEVQIERSTASAFYGRQGRSVSAPRVSIAEAVAPIESCVA
jgi:tRNA-2-methylthio-N6-dimethylallyladenosine synthase